MYVNQRGESCYSSFQELASAYKIKTQKVNEKKNEEMKNKFAKKFKCRACGQPLSYVKGTTVMTCTNPKCKGIKIKVNGEDEEEKYSYLVSYSLLGNISQKIAENIF